MDKVTHKCSKITHYDWVAVPRPWRFNEHTYCHKEDARQCKKCKGWLCEEHFGTLGKKMRGLRDVCDTCFLQMDYDENYVNRIDQAQEYVVKLADIPRFKVKQAPKVVWDNNCEIWDYCIGAYKLETNHILIGGSSNKRETIVNLDSSLRAGISDWLVYLTCGKSCKLPKYDRYLTEVVNVEKTFKAFQRVVKMDYLYGDRNILKAFIRLKGKQDEAIRLVSR